MDNSNVINDSQAAVDKLMERINEAKVELAKQQKLNQELRDLLAAITEESQK